MRKVLFLLCLLVLAFGVSAQESHEASLRAVGAKGTELGFCPLKHTAVRTDISGFIARVRVQQEFSNPYTEPIEAVYTFPLSHDGAVDDMTMTIGGRTIRGKIMKREEARQVYESAKSDGQTASLLDQERPNVFTQSVANIMPGEKIVVEISYVETLKYEDDAYEFVFPMTVGQRYKPAGDPTASKVSPPVAAARPGHEVSIEVNLNAGVPVEEIRSTSHEIQQINLSPSNAKVTLKSETTIPNKDFVLRYDVTGKKIEDAVLATRDSRGGFFTMVLQPPDRFVTEDITPKEIVFVLDTSGSMSGFPIEKAKEAMKLSLDGLHPNDTFNLITFAGDTYVLFEKPVPATQGNLERAQAFLASRSGGGGTEMMKAITTALAPSDSKTHLRIACFMTDGFVTNEDQIVAEIEKYPKSRVFSFGIGSSVNRNLLDRMAKAGNGEVEYVSLEDDGSKAARKFYERVRTPLLTDISIDWNGLPISDTYPAKLPDLFSAKPVIVNGRYSKEAKGTIRVRGMVAGQEYSREVAVNLPNAEPANDVLATLWARKRIDDLVAGRSRDAANTQKFDEQIAQLGLEFRILTENTSFVAVEDRIVNQNGKPVTIQVPVAIPEGVSQVSVDATTSQVSTQVIANLPPAARMVQGLYTVAPAVARSGLRDPSAKKNKSRKSSGNGQGSGVGYGSASGSGMGSGSGTGNGSGSPLRPAPAATYGDPNSNYGALPSILTVGIEEQKQFARLKTDEQRVKDKLHGWLYALVDRLRTRTAAGPNEARFVRDGKAEIRLTLSSKPSAGVLEKLRKAGFEITSEKGVVVSGRIAIDKLAALAEIDEILLALPIA